MLSESYPLSPPPPPPPLPCVWPWGRGARESGRSVVRKLPLPSLCLAPGAEGRESLAVVLSESCPLPSLCLAPGAEGQERLAVVLSESCPQGTVHCGGFHERVYYIFPRELSRVMSHFVSATCTLVSFFQGLWQCVLCMCVSVCVNECACAHVHFLARVLTSIISGDDVTVSNCASLVCDIFTKVVNSCGACAQWQWLEGPSVPWIPSSPALWPSVALSLCACGSAVLVASPKWWGLLLATETSNNTYESLLSWCPCLFNVCFVLLVVVCVLFSSGEGVCVKMVCLFLIILNILQTYIFSCVDCVLVCVCPCINIVQMYSVVRAGLYTGGRAVSVLCSVVRGWVVHLGGGGGAVSVLCNVVRGWVVHEGVWGNVSVLYSVVRAGLYMGWGCVSTVQCS